MTRSIEITVPSHATDALLTEIQHLDGLIGVRLQRGVSLQPPGDVITVDATTQSLHMLMRLLQDRGVGRSPDSSIKTSEPASLISASAAEEIARGASDATWEEMETTIGKESNMTVNGLTIMAISGILATIGITTNALHIVIGAMLIAPGFEPLVRIALGAVAGGAALRRGLSDTAKGYAVLVLCAAVTALVLQVMGKPVPRGEPSYLPAGVLVSYWTSITAPSLIVTVGAGIGGALLVATNRSVLTGGVMVALALVPSAAITGMAAVVGDLPLAGRGLLRWLIELGLVTLFSMFILVWKHSRFQQRKMIL